MTLVLLAAWQQAAAQQLKWITFQDPREHAFTVEIPAGWSVAGGLLRPTPSDPRQILEIRSPDGTIEIGLNDKDLPGFALPVPMYAQMGMREGAPVGGGSVLMAYRNGVAFAIEYGQRVYSRPCGHNLQVVMQNSDDAQGMRAAQNVGVPGATGSSGVAVLQCKDTQHGFFGIIVATTVLMPFPNGGGFWQATPIRVAVTDQAKAQMAMEVMTHLTGSIQVNPQWQAAENQAQQQAQAIRANGLRASAPGSRGPSVADINRDLSEYRRGVINHNFNNHMAEGDRVQRNVIDTIRGEQRLVDPSSGRQYVAPYGYNQYGLTQSGGGVVGSMGGGVPGTTELLRNNH